MGDTTQQQQQLIYGDWIPAEGGPISFQKYAGLEVRVPEFCLVRVENLEAYCAGARTELAQRAARGPGRGLSCRGLASGAAAQVT